MHALPGCMIQSPEAGPMAAGPAAEHQSWAFCDVQVKDLARLSLRDPEYVAVHAEAQAPTPLKLRQVTFMPRVCDSRQPL